MIDEGEDNGGEMESGEGERIELTFYIPDRGNMFDLFTSSCRMNVSYRNVHPNNIKTIR